MKRPIILEKLNPFLKGKTQFYFLLCLCCCNKIVNAQPSHFKYLNPKYVFISKQSTIWVSEMLPQCSNNSDYSWMGGKQPLATWEVRLQRGWVSGQEHPSGLARAGLSPGEQGCQVALRRATSVDKGHLRRDQSMCWECGGHQRKQDNVYGLNIRGVLEF